MLSSNANNLLAAEEEKLKQTRKFAKKMWRRLNLLKKDYFDIENSILIKEINSELTDNETHVKLFIDTVAIESFYDLKTKKNILDKIKDVIENYLDIINICKKTISELKDHPNSLIINHIKILQKIICYLPDTFEEVIDYCETITDILTWLGNRKLNLFLIEMIKFNDDTTVKIKLSQLFNAYPNQNLYADKPYVLPDKQIMVLSHGLYCRNKINNTAENGEITLRNEKIYDMTFTRDSNLFTAGYIYSIACFSTHDNLALHLYENHRCYKYLDPLHLSEDDNKLLYKTIVFYKQSYFAAAILHNINKEDDYFILGKSIVILPGKQYGKWNVHALDNYLGKGTSVQAAYTGYAKFAFQINADRFDVHPSPSVVKITNYTQTLAQANHSICSKLPYVGIRPWGLIKLNGHNYRSYAEKKLGSHDLLFYLKKIYQQPCDKYQTDFKITLIANLIDAVDKLQTDFGIIHFDIKCDNIRIDIYGGVYLLDFNQAECIHEFKGLNNRTKGSAGYVAPEILKKEKVDKRADWFSLGVVITLLLNGDGIFWKPKQRRHQLAQNNPDYAIELQDHIQQSERYYIDGIRNVGQQMEGLTPGEVNVFKYDVVMNLCHPDPQNRDLQAARLAVKEIIKTRQNVNAAPSEQDTPTSSPPPIDRSPHLSKNLKPVSPPEEPTELNTPSPKATAANYLNLRLFAHSPMPENPEEQPPPSYRRSRSF